MAKDEFKKLVSIVAKLRSPKGCPWDLEQTPKTLKPYMVEEVYEAIEAIDQNDDKKLCEELGDMLLHIVMQAQFASEKKKFKIDDVIRSINDKMIRRHPHVFGKKRVKTAEQVLQRWEKIKQGEIAKAGEKHKGILDSIPQSLPALYRADKVQRRAARFGFDWNSVAGAWKKVYEEIREIKSETRSPKSEQGKVKAEIGDLLFAVVNIARKLGIDAEEALQNATSKFARRFKEIEAHLKKKKLTLRQMDKIWNEAKKKV